MSITTQQLQKSRTEASRGNTVKHERNNDNHGNTYKTIAPQQLCNEFDNEIEDEMLAAIKLPEENVHTTPHQ
jgi:hypothetical protein